MYKNYEIGYVSEITPSKVEHNSSDADEEQYHRDHDLPAITYAVLAAIFGSMMFAAFAVFWHSAEATFMVVISAIYLVMYMGVPFLMYGINPKLADGRVESLSSALKRKVHTLTGPLTGLEAMAQVLTVPIALLTAFMSMGIILFAVI